MGGQVFKLIFGAVVSAGLAGFNQIVWWLIPHLPGSGEIGVELLGIIAIIAYFCVVLAVLVISALQIPLSSRIGFGVVSTSYLGLVSVFELYPGAG